MMLMAASKIWWTYTNILMLYETEMMMALVGLAKKGPFESQENSKASIVHFNIGAPLLSSHTT